MNWKGFFRPTLGRLIAPVLFFIWVIYYDLFNPIRGTASILERFIMTITDVTHIIFVLILLFILYFLSCSISKLILKFKKQKK